MTVNPVDMQVIIQQTGQVNRIQRGLQFQQQVEQQIIGQQIRQDMKNKESSVQQMSPVDHNKIENKNSKDKRRGKEKQESSNTGGTSQDITESKEQKTAIGSKDVGTLLDIKV